MLLLLLNIPTISSLHRRANFLTVFLPYLDFCRLRLPAHNLLILALLRLREQLERRSAARSPGASVPPSVA